MTRFHSFFRPVLISCLALALVLTACDSSGPSADETTDIDPETTAEMIAVTLAEDNGGTADDLASADQYVRELQSGSNASIVDAKAVSRRYDRDCTYSDARETWSCTVSAARTTDRTESTFDRSVEVQFFDADGNAQRNYIANGDTAQALSYTVLSGSGSWTAPRVSTQHTLPADGQPPNAWTVENPGTGVLTINGSGSRSIRGEQMSRRGSRTRDATITTQASAVVVERGEGIQSGTIGGTYDAEVVLTNADGEEFTRTISIEYEAVFSGDTVSVTFVGDGERFNGRTFTFESASGEPA